MPESNPPKVTKFATKKIGPLPVWAWGLGALVFIGVVWYMRRNAGDETTVTTTDSDYGQEPIAPDAPPFTGGNGGGDGGGYIDIPFPELPPPVAPYPDWPYQPNPPQPIYEDPREPIQTQPITETPQPEPKTEPAPPPAKQTQFTWSGQTFRKGDLAKFRKLLKNLPKSSIYSGPNGYAVWAKNHPKVVADFGWPRS